VLRPHDGEDAELGHVRLAPHERDDAMVFIGFEAVPSRPWNRSCASHQHSGFDRLHGGPLASERSPASKTTRQARQTIELNRSSWNLFEGGDITTVARGLAPGNLGLRRRQLSMLAGGHLANRSRRRRSGPVAGAPGWPIPRAKCLGAFLLLADRFLPPGDLSSRMSGIRPRKDVRNSVHKGGA